MAGVYGDGSLGAAFRQVLQRLRALETQQQSVISDNLGRPVITDGLVPGSNPPLYGRMVWDPNTNTRLMFSGYDSGSDTAYTAFYDSNGNVVNKFDQTGQHVYDATAHEVTRLDQTGLHVYDDSGTEEVAAGLINVSPAIYGLAVLPQETGTPGAVQMVGGEIYLVCSPPGTVNTAGVFTAFTAWVGGAASVTVNVGPSGIVDVSSLVNISIASITSGTIATGSLGISVNGDAVGALGQFAGPVGANMLYSVVYPFQVPPGTNTFEFYYATVNGSVGFLGPGGTGNPAFLVSPR